MFCCSAFTLPTTPWLLEAEKKHGRVALLAVPSLLTIAAATGEDPVPWLSQQDTSVQLTFFSAAAVVEAASLRRFENGFDLAEGVTPGVWGNANATEFETQLEDASGRVAMLAATGMLASSLFS